MKLFKALLKDEDGDLIQNIIWVFGGVLAGAGVVYTLFGTVKSKISSSNNTVSNIQTP